MALSKASLLMALMVKADLLKLVGAAQPQTAEALSTLPIFGVGFTCKKS